MKIINTEVNEALEKVYKETSPISVFIYGSRARTDFKVNSDYEVGAIYWRKDKVGRREIATLHKVDGLNIYPFVMEDLEKYNLDTPFPKAIYLKELIGSSKTVLGEEILEKMEEPEIKLTDLLERISFDVATAFAAYRSLKTNDLVTASINFKSALFGVRVLEILELKKFPFTYDDIFEISKNLNLEVEYQDLLNQAMKARQGEKIEERFLFTNITFLNQVVLKKVRHELAINGDRIILSGKRIGW